MSQDTARVPGAQGSLSRRAFLGAAAVGALVVAFGDLADAAAATLPPTGTDPVGTALGGYVVIARDGTVTVLFGGAEMGQGGSTGLAQVVADELGASWADITVQSSPVGGSWATGPTWLTGGSNSIRSYASTMAKAGAQAREMLKAAAVPLLGVSDTTNLVAVASTIQVAGSPSSSVTFAQIVSATTAWIAPPANPVVGAMPVVNVGAPVARLDIPAKTNGSALYGIDVTPKVDPRLSSGTAPAITGATGIAMNFAVVKGAPVAGGTLTKTPSVPPGATAVVNLGDACAVVSTNTWAALQAAAQLQASWTTPSDASSRTSSTILSQAQTLMTSATATSSPPALVAEGDPAATGAAVGSTPTIDRTYYVPYLAHVPMEVPNATVLPVYTGTTLSSLEVWAPTQAAGSGWALTAAANASGLPESAIRIHTTLLGGGFGRKIETDFVVHAVKTAVGLKKPVKVIWPREQDVTHDVYRPMALARIRATVDPTTKRITAWSHRNVTQSILQRFGWWALGWGIDGTAVEDATTATGVPYAVASKSVEWVPLPVQVPVGFWRSVGAAVNAFFVESAMDELALAAGIDPYTFRMNQLAASTDPRAARFASVLKAANDLANSWGSVPTGRARGLSLSTCFDSIVAEVAEVTKVVSSTGVVSAKVNRVAVAYDVGPLVVNPNAVEAQMQGGVSYGLSATLWDQITFTSGKADQSNFNKYKMVRGGDMPVVSTVRVTTPGVTTVGGVGEIAVPGVAPAVVNAWASLTGTRVRTLPMFPGLTMGG